MSTGTRTLAVHIRTCPTTSAGRGNLGRFWQLACVKVRLRAPPPHFAAAPGHCRARERAGRRTGPSADAADDRAGREEARAGRTGGRPVARRVGVRPAPDRGGRGVDGVLLLAGHPWKPASRAPCAPPPEASATRTGAAREAGIGRIVFASAPTPSASLPARPATRSSPWTPRTTRTPSAARPVLRRGPGPALTGRAGSGDRLRGHRLLPPRADGGVDAVAEAVVRSQHSGHPARNVRHVTKA